MKKITLIIALALGVSAFSQTNVVQEGYYEIIDKDGNIFDSKESEKETIQAIYNYYINTGEIATYNAPTFRVDFDEDVFGVSDTLYIPTIEYVTDTVYIDNGSSEIRYVDTFTVNNVDYNVADIVYMTPEKVTDTILVNTCFNGNKVWYHHGDANIYPHDISVPFKETSMISVEFDSLPTFNKIYQKKFKLERKKNHGLAKTTYKSLDVPFQFYITDSTVSKTASSVSIRTFASENHGVMYYIDGDLEFDGSNANPGQTIINGGLMFRHTHSITGLEPETTYELKVVIKNIDGVEQETVRNITTSQ